MAGSGPHGLPVQVSNAHPLSDCRLFSLTSRHRWRNEAPRPEAIAAT